MPTLQTLVDWANIGVVIALAVSFVVGGASIFFSRKLGTQKDAQHAREKQLSDERIALADTKAAEANAQAARANEGLGKSNEEIARLTAEAEKAKTERAEADKQIAIAKADAAKAKEGTANAEAVSAKAAVEVAGLQVVVANAEKRRFEAEKALLELQERLKDRHITPEQRARMLEILKAAPKGKAGIRFAFNSTEAENFANQIAEILATAGWEVAVGGPVIEASQVIGIGLFVRNEHNAPGSALQRALEAIGFRALATRSPGSVKDFV